MDKSETKLHGEKKCHYIVDMENEDEKKDGGRSNHNVGVKGCEIDVKCDRQKEKEAGELMNRKRFRRKRSSIFLCNGDEKNDDVDDADDDDVGGNESMSNAGTDTVVETALGTSDDFGKRRTLMSRTRIKEMYSQRFRSSSSSHHHHYYGGEYSGSNSCSSGWGGGDGQSFSRVLPVVFNVDDDTEDEEDVKAGKEECDVDDDDNETCDMIITSSVPSRHFDLRQFGSLKDAGDRLEKYNGFHKYKYDIGASTGIVSNGDTHSIDVSDDDNNSDVEDVEMNAEVSALSKRFHDEEYAKRNNFLSYQNKTLAENASGSADSWVHSKYSAHENANSNGSYRNISNSNTTTNNNNNSKHYNNRNNNGDVHELSQTQTTAATVFNSKSSIGDQSTTNLLSGSSLLSFVFNQSSPSTASTTTTTDDSVSTASATTKEDTLSSLSDSSAGHGVSAEERLYNKTMELFPHLQAIMKGFQSGAWTNNDTAATANDCDNGASSTVGNLAEKMSPIFPDLMLCKKTLTWKQETDLVVGVTASSCSIDPKTSSSAEPGEDDVSPSTTTTTDSSSTPKIITDVVDKEHEEFLRRLTSPDPSSVEVVTAPPTIVDIFKPERIKRHKCDICSKAFGRSSDLRRHIRIHTGEKNHKCPVCHKAFNQSGDLQRHIKTHSGERPYVCTVCGKSFSQKGDVRIHARIHSGERPHTCQVCHKSFNQSSYLATHMKTHTGQRSHACVVCGKAFVDKSDLKKHVRIHSGEKPHQCTVCHKAFNRNNNLVRHMVNIHGLRHRYNKPPSNTNTITDTTTNDASNTDATNDASNTTTHDASDDISNTATTTVEID